VQAHYKTNREGTSEFLSLFVVRPFSSAVFYTAPTSLVTSQWRREDGNRAVFAMANSRGKGGNLIWPWSRHGVCLDPPENGFWTE